jgi:hypothetical protein
MAKKATKRGGFNMSATVRDVLSENRELTGREVEAEVRKRYPKEKINPKSLNVAFTNARQKLGISKKRKSVRKRKPSTTPAARTTGKVDMSALQAARKFVAEVGDADQAMEAVRQLKTLQIG